MDELIFTDGHDKEELSIHNCDKMSVAKQLCQAVAYLLNLKAAIVHRDIKLANVLAARKMQIIKLCHMGLSRLKSQQSLRQTCSTSVTGTPFKWSQNVWSARSLPRIRCLVDGMHFAGAPH